MERVGIERFTLSREREILEWLGSNGCLDEAGAEISQPENEIFDKPVSILRLDQKALNAQMGKQGEGKEFTFDLNPQILDEFRSRGSEPLVVPSEFEVWAWYQPLHFYGECWGIYIKEEAIKEIASRIFSQIHLAHSLSPYRLISESIYSAFQILYLHELYHHKVESFAIRSHITTQVCTFMQYESKVFRATRTANPSACKEEALCHAFARTQLPEKLRGKVSRDVVNAAVNTCQEILDSAAGPYAGASIFLNEEDFVNAQSYLQNQIQEGSVVPVRSDNAWKLDPKLISPLFSVLSIPCFIVPKSSPQIHLPGVYEFTAPKKGVERVICSDGYSETPGGKGSHTKYRKPGAPMLILPKGKELSATVLKSVAKALDIELQQLVKMAREA